MFCTTAEGVRADRAKEWKLVDHVAKPQQFAEFVRNRALELAKQSDRPGGEGIVLTPLVAESLVSLKINKDNEPPNSPFKVRRRSKFQLQRNASWYPLQLARELDDAILNLRHNHLDVGLWILKTHGKRRRRSRPRRSS